MKRNYKHLFSTTKDINITVVGDLMLDKYIWGRANRLSAESPVPIVLVESETEILGGAGNVAANLCGLGANVNVIGVVGADQNGKQIIQLLNDLGCETKGIIHSDSSKTITKIRVLAQKHQVVRIDYEDIKLDNENANLLERAEDVINNSQVVIISDYNKGTVSQAELSSIIDYSKKQGIITLVDPKTRDFSVYANCTCITPNLNEIRHAVPTFKHSDHGVYEAALTLQDKYNIDNIVITRGQDGMSLLTGGKIIHLPTDAKEVFDVSGAGDTVIATIGVCLAMNLGFETAVKIANTAAGIVVSHLGTKPINSDELSDRLKSIVTG